MITHVAFTAYPSRGVAATRAWCAFAVDDLEGNRIGLHQQKPRS